LHSVSPYMLKMRELGKILFTASMCLRWSAAAVLVTARTFERSHFERSFISARMA
jgi:hypothetical protein